MRVRVRVRVRVKVGVGVRVVRVGGLPCARAVTASMTYGYSL